MTPPALLFDLDGTLVDSARDIARALSAVRLARGGTPIDVALVRPLVSEGAATLVREALGDLAGDAVADLADFRRVLLDLPADPGAIYPGVAQALTALGVVGHPMAIVTNKPEGLARALLAALGLDRHFGAIVGGDTAAFPKPHRAPIDLALAALGVVSEHCLFIGDSDIDGAAAQACGVPFLLFEGGYGVTAATADGAAGSFVHFDELAALVARQG